MDKLPAVILAAGKGQRLGNVTDNTPKPMVEVNNVKIIDNLIDTLIENNIEQVVVVTGYLHRTLADHLRKYNDQIDLKIIENEIYDTTNNIYSLWKAKDFLTNGFYLFEADVFFESKVMKELIELDRSNIMLVGKHTSDMDGTVIQMNKVNQADKMFLKRHQSDDFDFSEKYKTINFYKIGPDFTREYFLAKLQDHIDREDLNSYYELIIEEALNENWQFYCLDAGDLKWWEIDTQKDLDYCTKLFK